PFQNWRVKRISSPWDGRNQSPCEPVWRPYPVCMSDILTFAQVRGEHADLVGGKGLSLALTAAAGLPVPPGFCVTTTAYRRLGSDPQIDDALQRALAAAYRELGGGPVAVR